MNLSKKLQLLKLTALFCFILVTQSFAEANMQIMLSKKGFPVLVSTSAPSYLKLTSKDFQKDSKIKEVANELNKFFKDRGYATVSSTNEGAHSSIFLLTENHLNNNSLPTALLKETSDFFKGARNEAYVFYVSDKTNRPKIFLIGKTISGLRAAAERLRAKIINDGHSLTISTATEKNNPFIFKRLVNIGDAARRQTPYGSPFKSTDISVWPSKKLFAYPELYRQFGFNGIQIGECRGYGSISGKVLERARKAAISLAKGARKSGMIVSWFVWGDALFDEFRVLCWNDPKERKIMEDFHREQAGIYGKYVDHINVHISDPGGCTRNGCDPYKTRQQIANYIISEFRKINPKIEGTFSTWGNGAFWLFSPKPVGFENYFSVFLPPPNQRKFGKPIPDGAKFLDDSFMPKNIGIALNRFYQADQAELVVKSGRPLDIWGWYISDYEMRNNLAFNMKNIDKYFRSIPQKASKQIRYYNSEIIFHGWPQIINAYVVVQKMWNPKRPLNEIEMEFCTATFGPQNAKAMYDIYNAVEGGYDAMIPHPANFGTTEYNRKLREVLSEAKKVHIPKNWKPNFDFETPVTKYVDMLIARLRLILAVSEAKEKVDKARAKLNINPKLKSAKSVVFKVIDANGLEIISTQFSPNPYKLEPGHSIGQTFSVIRDFSKIGIMVCTWGTTNSGLTFSLYDKPGGKLQATMKFTNILDNKWIWLKSKSRFSSGGHYFEISNAVGDSIGVYGLPKKVQSGSVVYFDGKPLKDDNDVIKKIKQDAIKKLPKLPIDPIYKQDKSIVYPTYRTATFAEMIKRM